MSVDEVNAAVDGEGWGIFESYGSQGGPLQIQRIDEEEVFDSDGAAWDYVWRRAREEREGVHQRALDLVHQRALDLVKEHNPMEYAAIEHWCTTGEPLDQPPYDYGEASS